GHLAPARPALRTRYERSAGARAQRRVRRGLSDAPDTGGSSQRRGGGRREHAAEVDLLLPQAAHGAALQPALSSSRPKTGSELRSRPVERAGTGRYLTPDARVTTIFTRGAA